MNLLIDNNQFVFNFKACFIIQYEMRMHFVRKKKIVYNNSSLDAGASLSL